MKVATLERIRREKNRDAERFRSAFFARGNQPLSSLYCIPIGLLKILDRKCHFILNEIIITKRWTTYSCSIKRCDLLYYFITVLFL